MANIRKPLLDEDGFPIRQGGGGDPIDVILDGDDDWPSINSNKFPPGAKVVSKSTNTTQSNTTVTETGGGSVTVKRSPKRFNPDGTVAETKTDVIVEEGNNAQLNIQTNNGQVTSATLTGVRDENNQGDGIPQATGGGTVTVINSEVAPGESVDLLKEGVDIGQYKNTLNSLTSGGEEILEDGTLETNVGKVIKAADKGRSSFKSNVKQLIPTAGRVSQPNFLHRFANYTYNMELYLLTADDYNAFANDPTYSIESQPERLLIKTGGGNYRNRNPYFTLDYYIDDLEIDSIISPGGANKGSVNTNVSFKITEPYGMTLLNSFVMAANHFGCYNYIDQPYLLKVTITGYDSSGKVYELGKGLRTRYIPIRFTDFKFGVDEKGTTYDVTAIPYNSTGLKSTSARMPVDVQIEAKTVNDFFNVAINIEVDTGNTRPSGPPNQPGIPIIEKQTEKGLTGYLNKLEDEHVKAKLKAVPDIYAFAIDPEIAESKIVLQEAMDLSKTKNDKEPSKLALGQFSSNFTFDETTKTYSIRAGINFVDVIHSMLRSCEYMTNQVVSADLKKDKEATEEYEEVQDKPIKFYRIVPEVKLGPFDKIRNQYAKMITYHVKRYDMTGKDFENLGKKPVEFIAKKYDYFYTGKNTDILSFDIEFNAAYYQTYTYNKMKKAGQFPTPLAETNLENTINEGQTAKSGNNPITKWTPYIREVTTNTRTSTDINDPQVDHKSMTVDNFMQEVFDQGTDLLHMNMRIIGDMSYIQSKDMRSVATGIQEDYYLPDGSLNTDKEWHIFVKFRNPVDLDASTGLMKGFNVNVDGVTDVNTPSISGQYRIIKVTSNFSGGQFTQNLETIRERNQELNTLKEKDKKKPVNERKNKDVVNSRGLTTAQMKAMQSMGTPTVKQATGTGLTGDQRNAFSSMQTTGMYTPDSYMSVEERGQLQNMDVDDIGGDYDSSGWQPPPQQIGNDFGPKPRPFNLVKKGPGTFAGGGTQDAFK